MMIFISYTLNISSKPPIIVTSFLKSGQFFLPRSTNLLFELVGPKPNPVQGPSQNWSLQVIHYTFKKSGHFKKQHKKLSKIVFFKKNKIKTKTKSQHYKGKVKKKKKCQNIFPTFDSNFLSPSSSSQSNSGKCHFLPYFSLSIFNLPCFHLTYHKNYQINFEGKPIFYPPKKKNLGAFYTYFVSSFFIVYSH